MFGVISLSEYFSYINILLYFHHFRDIYEQCSILKFVETYFFRLFVLKKDTRVHKTVTVDVEAKGHRVVFTVKTDAATLGEALYALELINDPSFFDTANGIKADWNADSAYWAYFQGDQYMSVGVNDTPISGGEHYRLVYTQ